MKPVHVNNMWWVEHLMKLYGDKENQIILKILLHNLSIEIFY